MRRAGAVAGMRVVMVICALALALTSHAALAGPQLELTHEPPPRHLRMRPRAAAAPPPAARPATPMPAAPPPLSPIDPGAPSDRGDDPAAVRDVREQVSFSLTIGYQVDGARPSGKASLAAPVQEGRDYTAIRSYGFGELFFSMRGVALDSLSSYFALRLDAAQRETYRAPGQTTAVRVAPPIATWFDHSLTELRTGWGEMKDFLPRRFGMRKLRVRAGSQYVYGPWVLHLNGIMAAYDGDIVTATVYGGSRHTDYAADLANEIVNQRYAVGGGSVRVDLRQLASVPIAIYGEVLGVTSTGKDPTQPNSSHGQLEIDWQPRRDFTVFAQARTLDGKLANERVQFRARYRQVTNLVFDVMRRFDTDWRWDPSLIADDSISARRYLDLGPVLPQFIASLRGGTLIAENVDLLARGTIAGDLTKTGETKSSFSAAYVELGGALELRLRRTVALGASVLSRQTQREDLASVPITDVRLVPQPLAPSAATGEKGFTEIGARMRMSLGARQFSAMAEVYGRQTRYAEVYRDPTNPIDGSDIRGGGRVTLDAWINKRLRLFASYDLSTAVAHTPEITSYKSLRLTMTGVY